MPLFNKTWITMSLFSCLLLLQGIPALSLLLLVLGLPPIHPNSLSRKENITLILISKDYQHSKSWYLLSLNITARQKNATISATRQCIRWYLLSLIYNQIELIEIGELCYPVFQLKSFCLTICLHRNSFHKICCFYPSLNIGHWYRLQNAQLL